MAREISEDSQLQADINKLKDSAPYKEKFETPEVQQLNQAVDILARLGRENYMDSTRVGYEKVRNAKIYLDHLLKKQFDAPEEKTE